MLRVAICDDCSVQAGIIMDLFNNYQTERIEMKAQVSNFDSGEALLKSISSGDVYDLMLLDILMPGIDGIELAQEIRKHDEDVKLIYLTSTKEYAIEAFNVYAAHYIVKPITEGNLFPVLDKIIPMPKREVEPYITLSLPERNVKVPFSSLICLELSNRKLHVSLEDGDRLSSKFLRQSFETSVAPLLKDSRFFQTHKSYVVNLMHALEMRSNSFIMKNNMVIPITRSKLAEAKERFFSRSID
jgi:DNA-binding LytR/AlgR family response regulator